MKRIILVFGCVALVGLSGCGLRGFEVHRSESGEILESYLPAEVDQVFSYSLRDDDAWSQFQSWSERLDLLPQSGVSQEWSAAFPERYRVVWTLTQDGEHPTVQGVATLKNADAVTPPAGFEPRTFLNRTVYRSIDDGLSVIQQGDLLLFASDDSTLLSMADRAFDTSLWDSRLYRRALSQMGPHPLFYWIAYRPLQDSRLFAMNDLDYRTVAVHAEQDGLGLKFYRHGAGLARSRSVDPYLWGEVDADGLLAYAETYDAADMLLSRPDWLSPFDLFMTQYFSTGFQDELAPFLKRGTALALYGNSTALFPEFTLMIDVSDDEDSARGLMTRLDTQLQSVVERFTQAVPGSMIRATVQWNGSLYSQIRLDLALLNGANSAVLVPPSIPLQPLTLTYGVDDGRLMISTHALNDSFVSVADSDLYAQVKSSAGEGSFLLVDPERLSDALVQIDRLRSALHLGLSESPWTQPELLNEFSAAIVSAEGGFLKFKHE